MTRQKTKTIPMPVNWQNDFRNQTMRTSFQLNMSQAMIQFLSATADGVQWDRWQNSTIYSPSNDIATAGALVKRGLIVRKCKDELDRETSNRWHGGEVDGHQKSINGEWSCYRLTPAGEAVVNLFKVTGIFIESDAAIIKKSRRRG